MRFVYDEKELEKFFNLILKPLEKDEVYFLSLSARNKYLTPEERVEYDLGRTEMMMRKLVKEYSFPAFLRTVRSYEIETGISGRGFKSLPQKCIAVYANINVCSGKRALQEFYQNMNETLFNLANDAGALERLRYLDTELLNCFQRSRGARTWIDVDFDCPSKELGMSYVDTFREDLTKHGVEHHVISTRSGFHVLLRREDLNYNYTEMVRGLDEVMKKQFPEHAEVVVNKNEMCPIPGVLSAGFEVRMIR